ncbi:hypothetical protein Bca52824_001872 [Brassica carinata]|uniref:Uncharacterized protein n=1 Tax=Brassica carinata TaxID=52824 RepID=A0A8X7WJS5_BRACI|nr:hypothetical protein Bca52824_001872 [Brassica carinata]
MLRRVTSRRVAPGVVVNGHLVPSPAVVLSPVVSLLGYRFRSYEFSPVRLQQSIRAHLLGSLAAIASACSFKTVMVMSFVEFIGRSYSGDNMGIPGIHGNKENLTFP